MIREASESLEQEIGPVVRALGEVRIATKMLPDLGTLYQTTNGLFFLPYHFEKVTRIAHRPEPSTSLLWTLAAIIWPYLLIALPFIGSKSSYFESQDVHSDPLTEGDNKSLAEALTERRGSIFIPHSTIEAISPRWRRWKVQRVQRTAILVTPLEDRHEFARRLETVIGA